ncbi:hypothetical protein BMETH_221411851737, partial [methanotrophic bacterial endosymbiont of Bathymodiolus sp.]
FDLSGVLNNGNVIYLEDMQKFAHKLRAIGYFLRVNILPSMALKIIIYYQSKNHKDCCDFI